MMRPGWEQRRPVLFTLLPWFVLVAALGLVVFHHFLVTFAVAAPVALLVAPAQRRLSRRLRHRRSLAAALIVLGCVLLVLLPILAALLLLAQQLVAFLGWLGPHLRPEALDALGHSLPTRFPWIAPWLPHAGTAGGTG